jgi:hypothetical protein
MKRYILDITDVENEEWEHLDKLPNKMECVQGAHYKDIDVDESKLSEEHRLSIARYYLKKDDEHFKRWGVPKYEAEAYGNPVGFNICDLPVNAKLERIE